MSRKLPGSAIVPGTITVTQITGGLNDTTNASYAQANTARTTANDAYGQANSAFAAANNSVLKAGDTMTGQLNISSGGLLVTGNVGIGTATPLEKLDVLGSVRIQNGNSLRLLTTTGSERGTIYATQATGALTAGLVIETSGDEEIVFKDAGEINMVIQGTGATGNGRSNVGIGTTSPTSKLHVVGNANITLGINTATVNATTINAQSFITSTGANVYSTALTAYDQANASYNVANTKLASAGGTLSGDLIITGNLTVSGNSTTLNTEILTVEDAEVVLLSNVASTPALNAGVIVNRGTSANTFLRWDEALDEWGWSDSGNTTYYFEDLRAGLATTNTTFGTVNTSLGTINTSYQAAYAQANTAGTNALNAYGQANTARTTANDAYGAANTASTASNRLISQDLRTIAPNSHTAARLTFGFTSYTNNGNASTYADYLHFRSYVDSSGGSDNLVMFHKSGIGMRIWQQTWNSSSAYSNYVDVLHSSNYSSYAVPLSGGTMTGTLVVQTDGGNEQFKIVRSSNTNEQLLFGFHSSDYGTIQAVEQNVAYRPLALNPNGGNVGIGTSNPQGKLTISNAGAEGIEFFMTGAVGNGPYFNAYNRSTGRYVPFTYYANTHTFYTNTGSTRAVDIDINGYMTVGTILNGEFGVFVVGGAKTLASGIPQYQIQAQDTAAMAAGVGGAINFTGKFTTGGSITSFASIEASKDNATTGEYGAAMLFKTRVNGGSQAEVMRLTSGGNVGIGTTSPGFKLHVRGADATAVFVVGNTSEDTRLEVLTYQDDRAVLRANDTSNTARILAFETGTTERARITSGGDFCVGSTEPGNAGTRNISIGNPGTTVGGLQLWSTTSGTHYVQFGDSAAGGAPYSGAVGYNHTDNYLMFWTNQSEKLRLDSTGHLTPNGDNSQNLGSTSKRWANIYTADLNMSNKGSQNDIDGTWGEWTIQEGEDNLYVINRRNGKKFKIKLEEV